MIATAPRSLSPPALLVGGRVEGDGGPSLVFVAGPLVTMAVARAVAAGAVVRADLSGPDVRH
jgi:hypothetical protein